MAAIGEAVRRMEAAGYRLEVHSGVLRVTPAERLTPVQRDWLRRNKPELVRHVKALALPDVRRLVDLFEAEVMTFEEHRGGVPADNDTTPVFPTP